MKYVSCKDSRARLETKIVKGQGTLSHPLQGDLRAILASQRFGETLQLLEGTFFLRAAESQTDYLKRDIECLSPALRLMGEGPMRTRIILDHHPDESAVMFFSRHDVEVRGFTLDVASVGIEQWKRDGLVLYGENVCVENVTVEGVYGNRARDQEAWGIFTGDPDARMAQRGHRVLHCRVQNFLGDYVNGISSCGSGGLWRGNTVLLPDCSIAADGTFRSGHFAGFNLTPPGHADLIAEDNSVIGGRDGFYGEAQIDGCTFRRNTIRGAWHGFRFPLSLPLCDSRFEENLVVLNGSTGGPVGFALSNMHGQVFENLDFCRNIIRRGPGPGELLHPLVLETLAPGLTRHLVFRDNVLGPGSVFKGCETAVRFSGNHCMDGEPMN